MIADAIRWLVRKPTRDDYPYPDRWDLDAYIHAMVIVHQPIQWRWWVRSFIRLHTRIREAVNS